MAWKAAGSPPLEGAGGQTLQSQGLGSDTVSLIQVNWEPGPRGPSKSLLSLKRPAGGGAHQGSKRGSLVGAGSQGRPTPREGS